MTADGTEFSSAEAAKNVNDPDTSTDVQILGDSPTVLSLGQLCEECETRTCGNAMSHRFFFTMWKGLNADRRITYPKWHLVFYTLKVTKELQWIQNGNKYQCSQLGMKNPAQSESELIRVAYVISKNRKCTRNSKNNRGRIVFNSGNYVVFTMQCASASQCQDCLGFLKQIGQWFG